MSTRTIKHYESIKTPEVTYSFRSSQPLKKYQLAYLNKCLEALPMKEAGALSDMPEWTTHITGRTDGEVK